MIHVDLYVACRDKKDHRRVFLQILQLIKSSLDANGIENISTLETRERHETMGAICVGIACFLGMCFIQRKDAFFFFERSYRLDNFKRWDEMGFEAYCR